MTLDARKDRTELRLKLYENGFTPLANKSKMCLIKGWSTLDVTPELIQSKAWARSGSFLDTGIRGGDVIALDFDVDDADLLNDLLDEVVEQSIVEESPFVRIGRPPRELWVYRTSDKIGKRTTGHFLLPGGEGSGYAVEVLGKGCQFAAYGQRDAEHAYQWPEESLLDHEYMDLPTITLPQVEALVAYATAFFERNGLERHSPGGGTDHGYTHVYDLDAEMVFDAHELGPVTVAELTAILMANPDDVIRVKADPFRPTSGTWSCMASLSGGTLCISDHGTHTSHFPVEADMQRAASALGELLAKRQQVKAEQAPPRPVPVAFGKLDPAAPFDVNLKVALERYVLVADDNKVCDLADLSLDMDMRHFHSITSNIYDEKPGPQGGKQISELSDVWSRSPTRRLVRTRSMRPDRSYPIYEEDGQEHVNTYVPNILPTHGDASLGLNFLENLLPIESELRYFMQWLGHKIDNPAHRGPGIIMVANNTYGTGRGTLTELFRCIFGLNMVANVPFSMFSGTTYQSQYNDWMVDRLMIVVDEAQEIKADVGRWQSRNNAYEKLKEIVDPGNNHTFVVRKGVGNKAGRTYASTVIMTNHADMVAIPINDRRFFVCENGRPMPDAFWSELRAWMAVPANVGAFVEHVRKLDRSDYRAFAPPIMTASKADMADASSSELDHLMDQAMTGLTNTLVCKDQILLRLEDLIAESTAEIPDDWKRVAERMFIRRTRKLIQAPDRVRVDGKQRTVRVIGRVTNDVVASPEAVIVELLKNGPVTRQVKSSGSVIAFRR